MQNKYNIGDTVLIPAEVKEIRANGESIYYLTEITFANGNQDRIAIGEVVLRPNNEWISVTERMPKDEQRVLLCRNNGYISTGHHSHLDKYWVTMDHAVPNNDVVAWMELPEPYKEDDNDEG